MRAEAERLSVGEAAAVLCSHKSDFRAALFRMTGECHKTCGQGAFF